MINRYEPVYYKMAFKPKLEEDWFITRNSNTPGGEKKKKEKGASHLTNLEEEEGELGVTFDKFPPYPLMFSGL